MYIHDPCFTATPCVCEAGSALCTPAVPAAAYALRFVEIVTPASLHLPFLFCVCVLRSSDPAGLRAPSLESASMCPSRAAWCGCASLPTAVRVWCVSLPTAVQPFIPVIRGLSLRLGQAGRQAGLQSGRGVPREWARRRASPSRPSPLARMPSWMPWAMGRWRCCWGEWGAR